MPLMMQKYTNHIATRVRCDSGEQSLTGLGRKVGLLDLTLRRVNVRQVYEGGQYYITQKGRLQPSAEPEWQD